jgi:hypothetical protein
MLRRAAGLIFVATLTLSFQASASAQPRRTNSLPAFTTAEEGGPDFALQGEYAGTVNVPGRGMERAGLQVVALGGGKFDAVRYRGGLPGAGWDRGEKARYAGEAAGGKLSLGGSKDKFTIAGGIAVLMSDAGKELGRLPKVERVSPTMGSPPPTGSIVLFDGSSTDQFQNAKVTPEGLLQAGVLTKMPVGAFQMHLEFRTPFMPTARGQQRGNSGVYIQQRYEVQVLDSFGLDGVENECGGLYRQTRPDVNMCLPPLSWQTYDIWFTPARFAYDGKTKVANARITVWHNGVPIHSNREITAKTGGGKAEAPQPLPINLQDHGNPVVYRNLWIVPAQAEYRQVAVSYQQPRGLLRWRHRHCR